MPNRPTSAQCQALRRMAHARKGLSAEDYALRLSRFGAERTRDLNLADFQTLVAELHRLPSAPRKRKPRCPTR